MKQATSREHFSDYWGHAEVAIYSILASLLTLTALVTIASAQTLGRTLKRARRYQRARLASV
jgi:hypothetical protein